MPIKAHQKQAKNHAKILSDAAKALHDLLVPHWHNTPQASEIVHSLPKERKSVYTCMLCHHGGGLDSRQPSGYLTSPLSARAKQLVSAVEALDADEACEACEAALRSMHLGFPSDLPAVTQLLAGTAGDGSSASSYAALQGMLRRSMRGACSWALLQGCDAASLQAWAGEARMWVLRGTDMHCIVWPTLPVFREAVHPKDLTGERYEITKDGRHSMAIQAQPGDLMWLRELAGSMALVLCAAEPVCRSMAGRAGLPMAPLARNAVLTSPAGTTSTTTDQANAESVPHAAASAGGSGSAASQPPSGEPWGLHSWGGGSEATWEGCDLQTPLDGSVNSYKYETNAIALKRITGAQLAHGIASMLRPGLQCESAAMAAQLREEKAQYSYMRAWDSDDGGVDADAFQAFVDENKVDAAATAGHCNEGHAGAALWAVAAALVKLHGGVALSALLQAHDTIQCTHEEYGQHKEQVLQRLRACLGEDLPALESLQAAAAEATIKTET